MAIFSKGADPEALELSAERFREYAHTCLEVHDSVGAVAVAIKANWVGPDLLAMAGRIPAVQQQLSTLSTTLTTLGDKLSQNAKAQTTTSGNTLGRPGGTSGPGIPGSSGTPETPGAENATDAENATGGDGAYEKPTWLDAVEKGVKPLEIAATGLGATAFGLFSHTAGGGLGDLFTNGKLLDLYAEDVLKGVDSTKGLTSFEIAGSSLGGAMKVLDGRALGGLFAEGSKAGSLVGKLGVLGPISIGAGAVSTVLDVAHGDYGAAALDGASTALTAGALLAPPPADIVCGVGALGIAAYQNIPLVHDVVDGTVSAVGHAASAVADTVSNAASDAWDAVTSIF